MIAVGKDFGLVRKVRAAAVDEIDAWQMVRFGNLLRAEMLLDRHRIVSATFDGRIIADDHDLAPRDAPDPGDNPRSWNFAIVHVAGGELADFKERRTRIQELLDPHPREKLAARCVPLAMLFGSALRRLRNIGAKPFGKRAIVRCTRAEFIAVDRDLALELGCAHGPWYVR